jgi:hypothetical protein
MQREKKNIYTDSKYAFTTLHGQEVICKERGLLTTGEKRLKKKRRRNTPTAGSNLGTISSGCHALQRP